MSKKDLINLLRSVTAVECPIFDYKSQIAVDMFTARSAHVLSGSLNHMRNIDSAVEGTRVVIPLDDSGYTVRHRAHDPEPRP